MQYEVTDGYFCSIWSWPQGQRKESEAETERKATKRAKSMCEGLADSAINTVGSGGGQEKSMAFSTVLSGIQVLCLDCDLIN